MPTTAAARSCGPSGLGRAAGRGSPPRSQGRRCRWSGRRAPPRAGGLDASAPALDRLVEAGLELDRVVDREADQDRQHRDRGHRQRAADQPQQAEGQSRGGEREGQRQQAQAGAEDEPSGPAPSPRQRRPRGPAARPSALAPGRRPRPARRRPRSAPRAAQSTVRACPCRRRPCAASCRRPLRGSAPAPGGVRLRSDRDAGAGRSGPSGRWERGRRAAPSAPRAGRAGRRPPRQEFGVAEAGNAGDPVFRRDGEQYRRSSAGDTRAASRSSWSSIWITASLRKVAGPTRNLTGFIRASSAQGPGIGFAPGGTLPERHPSSRSSRPRFAVSSSRRRSPSASTTTGSSPKTWRTCWVAR